MVRPETARTRMRVAKPVLSASKSRTVQNKILLGLPTKERDAIFSKSEFVSLLTPTVLNEAEGHIKSVFFINDGLASVLKIMEDGRSIEVGLCGREGFVGLPIVAGFSTSPTRVVMQVGGSGFRISAKDFLATLQECPILAVRLRRFAHELALQAEQIAACNRLHEVDQRLARWLLMCQDRLGGNVVPLTQTFLAHILGTRRASVTDAEGILQRLGLISCSRGRVTIERREGLEDAACECYGVLTQQIEKWQQEVSGEIERTG